MAQSSEGGYEPSFRETHVDDTLEEHDNRITKNERRWLIAKGALVMLALSRGEDAAISAIMGII